MFLIPRHELAWLDDPVAARLEGESVGGAQLMRCIRCGTFVIPGEDSAVHAVHGSSAQRIQLADVPMAVRGVHGRKLALLRILAVEGVLRALLLLAVAVIVFAVGAHRDSVIAQVNALIASANPLAQQVGFDITHSHALTVIRDALGSSGTTYTLVGVGLVAYAVVQLVEGYGLWGGWRWAEYLAVCATAAFLPLEVYEIAHHPSPLKVFTFALNIVIVVYLIFKGRLFGVRGGHRRYLQEIRSTTLLGAELAAAGRDPQEQASELLV